MAGCARGDSIVNLQAALYSANNHHDNGEYTAIKKIESPELYHDQLIQDQRLISNEDGMLDTIRSYNDTNQYIGDLTIDSSNHVHVGHVFNTIINGTVKTHEKKSESKAECAKKAQTTSTEVVIKKPRNVKDILRQKSIRIWLIILLIVSVIILSVIVYLSLWFSTFTSSPILPTPGHSDDLGDGIQIIQRHEWLARDPLNMTKLTHPLKIVRILHTAGFKCDDYQDCAMKVLAMQGWQVGSQGMPDLAYNYMIGGDGNVYVARGPDVENEWMPSAIDVAYIGNFLTPYDQLSDKMEQAGKRLIVWLRKEGKITPDYVVIPHNQTYNTQSPGQNIYKKMIKWPHYDPSLYF